MRVAYFISAKDAIDSPREPAGNFAFVISGRCNVFHKGRPQNHSPLPNALKRGGLRHSLQDWGDFLLQWVGLLVARPRIPGARYPETACAIPQLR